MPVRRQQLMESRGGMLAAAIARVEEHRRRAKRWAVR
jgi:hypothetical protein